MKKFFLVLLTALLLSGCREAAGERYFIIEPSCVENNVSVETSPIEEFINPEFRTYDINEVFVDVPPMSQFPNYPAGCESVSAVMALNWAGNSVSVDEFIDNHLPQNSDFYW